MAAFLHILRADSASIALPIITEQVRNWAGDLTVVLMDADLRPALPPGISVRRLDPTDLDYHALLDLIFAADHVVAW